VDVLLLKGIELFNRGEYFECHEVLEDAWRQEHGPRRLFLQALIHVAVALHHLDRENAMGARGQLVKALRKLGGYLPSWESVDTGRLYREAAAVLGAIEARAAVPAYPRIHLRRRARVVG
jgi:predicted metal-dependent hydrolase